MTRNHEKSEWKRALFYVDLLLLAILAVSLIMLARDAYAAGYYEARASSYYEEAFWAMLRDAAIVIGSMAWLFYRYFRGTIQEMVDPWL